MDKVKNSQKIPFFFFKSWVVIENSIMQNVCQSGLI